MEEHREDQSKRKFILLEGFQVKSQHMYSGLCLHLERSDNRPEDGREKEGEEPEESREDQDDHLQRNHMSGLGFRMILIMYERL